MTTYYNEINPYAAQWLRNLVAAGHIAPGDVDDRDIREVKADDLKGYAQCHFFAGIGGWSVALRQSGWPDDRPVWTGSCPCQPFSAAGAGKAANDERHLWPAWFSLIAERGPAIIFGEQVEAAIGWGWLDVVFNDLEAEGYACGATILPACGVGAPHIRQRLWFVGHAEGFGYSGGQDIGRERPPSKSKRALGSQSFGSSDAGILEKPEPLGRERTERTELPSNSGRQHQSVSGSGVDGILADTECNGGRADQPQREAQGREVNGRSGAWDEIEWLKCTDGKWRPVEPGSFPLAHGVQRRTSKLRAYGNAIVPAVAAEFIGAFCDIADRVRA